jgi:hypothetical protein
MATCLPYPVASRGPTIDTEFTHLSLKSADPRSHSSRAAHHLGRLPRARRSPSEPIGTTSGHDPAAMSGEPPEQVHGLWTIGGRLCPVCTAAQRATPEVVVVAARAVVLQPSADESRRGFDFCSRPVSPLIRSSDCGQLADD